MAIQLNRMDVAVAGLDWRADYVRQATWFTQRKVYYNTNRDERTYNTWSRIIEIFSISFRLVWLAGFPFCLSFIVSLFRCLMIAARMMLLLWISNYLLRSYSEHLIAIGA